MKTVGEFSPSLLTEAEVRRFRRGAWEGLSEVIAREESVLVFHETHVRNLWAWPQDLETLALGHVLLELPPPERTEKSVMNLPMPMPAPLRPGRVERLPSAVGSHCLRVSLDAEVSAARREAQEPRIAAPALLERMRDFFDVPGHWDGTGSFHRAGLFCPREDRLTHVAEDIGRHNCLDRLAGFCALRDVNPASHILLISARITGSLYAKARRLGLEFMVSRSAVTSAALSAASLQNVTLAGFCRPPEERVTVFFDEAGRITA